MNCQSFQNRVLTLPDPRQLPEPLVEHSNGCAACAAWWRSAARLEGLLAVLPVPPAPADKKNALLDELAGPVIAPMPKFEPAKHLGHSRGSHADRPRGRRHDCRGRMADGSPRPRQPEHGRGTEEVRSVPRPNRAARPRAWHKPAPRTNGWSCSAPSRTISLPKPAASRRSPTPRNSANSPPCSTKW